MNGPTLNAYSGATLSMSLTCLDDAGDPFNLTGYSARGQIRPAVGSSTVTLDLSPTIPTPANGVISISKTDESTAAIAAGIYYWDVVLDTPTGGVLPVAGGTVKFRQLVTRTS
jgi:hypothetical protein